MAGLIAAAAALVACGGSDSDSDSAGEATRSAPRDRAASFVPPTPIPSDASTRGMWSPLYNWPMIAVHTVLLSDGRLLTYGSTLSGEQGGIASYDIWDTSGAPDAGHENLPNNTGTDLFCSSSVLLPPLTPSTPASVFIAGGDNWTGTQTTNTGNPNSTVLDVDSRTLTRRSNMLRSRWYSTTVTLPNGESYIQGGTGGTDRPEVRSVAARRCTGPAASCGWPATRRRRR